MLQWLLYLTTTLIICMTGPGLVVIIRWMSAVKTSLHEGASHNEIFAHSLNVILVSDAVSDTQAIVDAATHNAQVVLFDSVQDSLATLTAKLDALVSQTGEKIGTLAIVTHGASDTIDLGAKSYHCI